MKKFLLLLVMGLFLSSVLFIGAALDSNAAEPREPIVGTITLVGDNIMKVLEDGTGFKHEFGISQAQEEDLTTGYKVALETNNGKVESYTVLGIPDNVSDIVYSAQDLTGSVVFYPDQFKSGDETMNPGS